MFRRAFLLFTLLEAVSVVPLGATAQLNLVEEVEYPDAFQLLSSVRELSDGRVLVADLLKQMLAAIDMDAGTMDVWGAQGSGAQQYRQPDAVHALLGDSTLLVDLGNSRLTVVAPDGRFARRTPLVRGGRTPVLPRKVDGQEWIYFTLRNMQNFSDSSRIGRVTPGSDEVETIAKYKPQELRRTGGGGHITMQQVPMSLEDDWAVGEDGTVAVGSIGRLLRRGHTSGWGRVCRIAGGPSADPTRRCGEAGLARPARR